MDSLDLAEAASLRFIKREIGDVSPPVILGPVSAIGLRGSTFFPQLESNNRAVKQIEIEGFKDMHEL